MNTTIYDTIKTPEELNNYFMGLDDYDQPYFILLKFKGDISKVEKTCQNTIKQEDEDEIYNTGSLVLNEDLLFLVAEGEGDTIKNVTNNILSNLEKENITAYISVFCHNCLSEANETFKWCTQLLDEAIEKANGKSNILINDFTADDWPGIEKYLKKEN